MLQQQQQQQQAPLNSCDPHSQQQRLPHIVLGSVRQRQQQQGSHRQLQLLDLAFDGAVAAGASREYREYEYEEPMSDTELPRITARPSSARSTRSLHSVDSSREREYAGDPTVTSGGFSHYQQQQQHYQTPTVDYSQYEEDLQTQGIATMGSAQDESVLMEASDPELFRAGVEEHAKRLGIDPIEEADFLWIARESLIAPLPEGWYHVTATETGAPYYYNEMTGESRWDHPCDDQFRQIFTELKQKQLYLQSSRRYDHYSSSHANNSSLNDSGRSDEAHTASYYAAGSSNYQTMAWQDDPQQEQQRGEPTVVDAAPSGRTALTARYQDNENLSMYSNYPHQLDWSDAAQEESHTDQNGGYYNDNGYPYKAVNGFQDQFSEYDTESVPVAAVPQNGSARSCSSSPSRSSLAEAQQTERLSQQYLSQLQSIEELKAKDEQIICDLRIQIQSVSKQLELQEEKYQGLVTDKSKIDDKFSEYKDQLDGYVKKCQDLTATNQTMKRELLATRNRLEEQQDEVAKKTDSSDEIQRLTAQIGKEQALREEIEQKYAEVVKAQLRLNKEFEDSQSSIARLRDELAALRAAEQQNNTRASANAADASATAATVATLTKQLSDKEEELQSARSNFKRLQKQIEELKDGQTRTAESLQTKLSERLEQKDQELESERQQVAKLRKDLQIAAESKQQLEKQLEEQKLLSASQLGEAEDQHRALKRENRAFERDLKNLQSVSKERDEELTVAIRQVEALELKLGDQEQLIENARRAGFAEAERASAEIVRQAQTEKARTAELYAQELQARRKLHNRLMELQGNIRVFCRVRPIQPVEMKSDQAAPAIFFRDNDHESLELVVGGGSDNAGDGSKGGNFIGQKHAFEFDHIFQPTSTQAQVFEQTRALVVSALDGFNVCIFAYGQTGSGKTHTMEGSESDRGVNFRALQELFAICDDRIAAGNFECTMKLSILEVYNETIVDLLDNNNGSSLSSNPPGGALSKGLDVRMGKTGVYVDNLIEVEVFNEKDVIDLMKLGHSHRSVGSHDFNEHSSRSHLVLSIQIETVQRTENRRRVSKLHLIDLAGSERVSKTAASGQRLKEAQNINRSLSALGDVIAALGASSKHVPYRNSKLTFLLQDSLSGNSKVLMFVNVSPVQWNAWETLCSLNFASRCRNVALGQAKQNSNCSSNGGSSGPTNSNSALSPTPNGVGASNSGGMHATASMSSMSGNGAAVRSAPRGAPPSVPKSGQRVTYG